LRPHRQEAPWRVSPRRARRAIDARRRSAATPHITVEYSSNLEDGVDVRRLIDDLHLTVAQSGLFEPTAVRSRAAQRLWRRRRSP
jgi:5-carboxymethyl-2-hydroxymuconate isomerase